MIANKAEKEVVLVVGEHKLTPSVIKLAETVFDITTAACLLLSDVPDHREVDSRELFHTILDWAVTFERENPDPGSCYMDTVEEYAYAKLREYFEMEGENG